MDVVGKFKNGTIVVSNLKTEEGEHKCHFKFDITFDTDCFSYTYHFGETVYFSMYDFINGKQEKLQDENSMDNYLELTKDYFGITVNQKGANLNIKVLFDLWDDKEKLNDFLIELKAVCDVVLDKK